MKIIVPVTDWKNRYSVAPWMAKLIPDQQNKLTIESFADCFQVRSVAEERCTKKIGQVSGDALNEIRKALAVVLDIR